jgi:hypothetical protein
MKTIIITPKNENDFSFLSALLEKLGYDTHVLSDEEKEDMGLLISMVAEKKGDYVSEGEIMNTLKKK